ncbi:MAG: hypothetical protein ACREFF_15495 [Candidatus Udaeobacter sp.]
MKLSKIIDHLQRIQDNHGDLEVETIKGDLDNAEAALNQNDPFPVELRIKPAGAKPE